MTFIENKLGVLFLIIICYTAGRLHQWYKHTADREVDYARGYDDSATSLFQQAVRVIQAATTGSKRPVSGIARVSNPVRSTNGARHSAEDRETKTTRINAGKQEAA